MGLWINHLASLGLSFFCLCRFLLGALGIKVDNVDEMLRRGPGAYEALVK